MTAHVPDHVINDHPRVNLSGLQPYGVICGKVHANYGWGERRYKFAHRGCSALWKGYPATYRLHSDGKLELLSYELPTSATKSQTEIVNEELTGDFWLVLKPHFSGPRTYLPFKEGTVVENESEWVIHEPRLGRVNANEDIVDVAARFLYANLTGELIEEGIALLGIPNRRTWLVRLRHRSSVGPSDALQDSDVLVDESTRKAAWATMTAAEWEESKDPSRMMLAVFRQMAPLLSWRLVCVLGRRCWDHFRHEQERFAIETTERWLENRATDDDLNHDWFCASGSGAGLESGWSVALDLVNQYAGVIVPSMEVCDLLRKVFGNPFNDGEIG